MGNKALILGGDTDGNLGDLAILTAICGQLRLHMPDVEISITSTEPKRDQEQLGIFPLCRGWRGLPSLLNAARNADLVICGGGGLFQDDDSLVKMPYWATRLVLVKMMSGPIAGLSIGAGPLDYRISRLFARLALRQLDPVSVRDPAARSALAPLTRKNVEIVPDPAFLLDASPKVQARAALQESGVPVDETPLLGVAVRRWFHMNSNLIPYKYASRLGLQKNRGKRQMSTFVERLAATLDEIAERTKAHVVFMPTYNVAHEADADVCRAIASKMSTDKHTILLIDDPCLYKAVTGLLSVMLCGRMHPAIFAAGQGTPIVGIAYNPKFFGMFSMLEQEDRCISITDFVADESCSVVTEALMAAIREPEKYRPNTTEIENKTRQFIEELCASVGLAQ